jgi:hypothetical protein
MVATRRGRRSSFMVNWLVIGRLLCLVCDAEEEVEEKQEKREPGLDARWLSVGKKRRVSWLPLSL